MKRVDEELGATGAGGARAQARMRIFGAGRGVGAAGAVQGVTVRRMAQCTQIIQMDESLSAALMEPAAAMATAARLISTNIEALSAAFSKMLMSLAGEDESAAAMAVGQDLNATGGALSAFRASEASLRASMTGTSRLVTGLSNSSSSGSAAFTAVCDWVSSMSDTASGVIMQLPLLDELSPAILDVKTELDALIQRVMAASPTELPAAIVDTIKGFPPPRPPLSYSLTGPPRASCILRARHAQSTVAPSHSNHIAIT